MLKQLQELQRQRKLQEVSDARQENVMDKLSFLANKQYSGNQYGLLNYGIRVRDPSQMFMFGDKNLIQAFSNKLACSHNQGWSQESAGLLTEQKSQQAGAFGRSFIGDQSYSNGSSTQDLATSDPLGKKKLFKKEKGTESFGKTDNSSEVPLIQGGSWSAPMHSAVAEASSGDTGLHEERRDLSFQNPKLNENQPSKLVESGNHPTSWLHNKFHDTHFGKLKTAGHSGMSGSMERSLGFPVPNSSGNMLELLHKLEKEHTNSMSISEVPKADTDDAFGPSYNKSSRSPYIGLGLNPTSKRQYLNYFEPSRISQQSDHFDKPSQGPQSDNKQLPNQNYMTSRLVSVKKEDDQEWSTRSIDTWVDVSVQQNPPVMKSCELPSTSYVANSRMETGFEASKYVKGGNELLGTNANVRNSQGFEDDRGFPSKRGVIKNDNKLSQLTSNFQLNSSSNLNNHGASKTKKMSSIYDARFGDNAGKHLVIKEEFESPETNSNSLVEVASIDQHGTNEVARTHFSSIYMQHLDVAKQNMVVLKSKKRKYPTFEGLSWHKEVTEGSTRFHDMSTAEMEWARSVVRLPEKLKELSEQIALDSLWVVQRKRRLNLTTHLMQLLFRPAPAIVLSEDATAYCDTVIYYAAKLALGDACSLLASSSKKNMTSRKGSIDQDLLEIIRGFIDRSKGLEDEFSRLEKGKSSVLEVRMDFEDLEKFSVVNRFVKFHNQRPVVTASSSLASSKPKPNPQRYVIGLPMPKKVPEGQDCLCL